MIIKFDGRILQIIICIFYLTFFLQSCRMTPEAIEKKVSLNIEQLRNIELPKDSKEAKEYNKLMDNHWKFYQNYKEETISLIDSCLYKEIDCKKPNDLILLDLGYYLYLNGTDEQKKLAVLALYSINTNQQIIDFNFEQFFRFTHAVASDKDENILNFLDAKFLLNNTNPLILPLHSYFCSFKHYIRNFAYFRRCDIMMKQSL